MRGTILDYHFSKGTGLIAGEDGKRYSFAAADWKSDAAPVAQQGVDFEADGEAARAIYAQPPSSAQQPPGTPMAQSQKEGIIAIIGAASAWLIPVVGVVGAIVGIIFGIRAQRSAKIDGDKNGQGLGLAAVIIGALGLLVAVIVAVTALGFFAVFSSIGTGF